MFLFLLEDGFGGVVRILFAGVAILLPALPSGLYTLNVAMSMRMRYHMPYAVIKIKV